MGIRVCWKDTPRIRKTCAGGIREEKTYRTSKRFILLNLLRPFPVRGEESYAMTSDSDGDVCVRVVPPSNGQPRD